MGEAFAWIGQLVDWIGRWFPRWTLLDTTERAIKITGSFWRSGVTVIDCGPGVHWFWPVLTSFQPWPVVRQTDNLPTQTFSTLDDKTIAVGGMLVYEVTDIVLLLTTTHSASAAIADIALTAIHDVCCNMSWDDLKREQRRGTLDTKLRNGAQKQLTEYGVRVLKCMLTDLAQTRVLRLVQSTNVDQ